jgi:hypothetical protein
MVTNDPSSQADLWVPADPHVANLWLLPNCRRSGSKSTQKGVYRDQSEDLTSTDCPWLHRIATFNFDSQRRANVLYRIRSLFKRRCQPRIVAFAAVHLKPLRLSLVLGPLTLPGRREICLLRRVILESFDLYEAKTPLTSADRLRLIGSSLAAPKTQKPWKAFFISWAIASAAWVIAQNLTPKRPAKLLNIQSALR